MEGMKTNIGYVDFMIHIEFASGVGPSNDGELYWQPYTPRYFSIRNKQNIIIMALT